MIISYSNNFVVIRVPRAASTSLAFYFFRSGLVDPKTDVYKIEGSFSSWQEFEQYMSTEGAEFANLPKELKSVESLAPSKRKFSELVAKSAIAPDMPCVASMRNPFERYASGYTYVCKDIELAIEKNNGVVEPFLQHLVDATANVNIFWDFLLEHANSKKPLHRWYNQSDFFPDHAEVFNIENLHQHASKFILEKGGIVSDPIALRKNPDIFTPEQTDFILKDLTPDRRQSIKDFGEKDFELWEKAYAVYN